jgi:hypothetical protein
VVELEPAEQQAVEHEAAVEREAVAGSPSSQAAAVGPTLAKLAAARWRDGRSAPEAEAQAEPTARQQVSAAEQAAPSRPGRPVTALRDIRAQLPVDAAAGQVAAGAPGQQQPAAAPAPVERSASQASPWFSMRPAAEAEAPAAAVQSAPPVQPAQPARPDTAVGHPVAPADALPPQTEQAQRPQRTVAELLALAEGRVPAPVVEQPQPAPAVQQEAPQQHAHPAQTAFVQQAAAPHAVSTPADDVFAPRVPVAPQQLEEPQEPGRELTVDIAVEALVAYQEARRQDPNEEALAQYLFDQYGVTGRRSGAPASRGEMARIWPHLQERYAMLGRD